MSRKSDFWYWSGAEYENWPKGELGCAGSPGGYVSDDAAEMCWAVTGQTVEIGPTFSSVMAGFECCNFNFRVFSTQRPLPTLLALSSISSSAG